MRIEMYWPSERCLYIHVDDIRAMIDGPWSGGPDKIRFHLRDYIDDPAIDEAQGIVFYSPRSESPPVPSTLASRSFQISKEAFQVHDGWVFMPLRYPEQYLDEPRYV